MRKRIYIPVVSVAAPHSVRLLELIVEPGDAGGREVDYTLLYSQGLGGAAQQATQITRSVFSQNVMRPPSLFLTTSISGLSNSSGAVLGVVLGLLMYYGLITAERVIASGSLETPASSNYSIGEAKVNTVKDLHYRVQAALLLAPQTNPTPFFYGGTAITLPETQSAAKLYERNIIPTPILNLEDAINHLAKPRD